MSKITEKLDNTIGDFWDWYSDKMVSGFFIWTYVTVIPSSIYLLFVMISAKMGFTTFWLSKLFIGISWKWFFINLGLIPVSCAIILWSIYLIIFYMILKCIVRHFKGVLQDLWGN